jgi:uncharacterized protein (TIGR02246 family)
MTFKTTDTTARPILDLGTDASEAVTALADHLQRGLDRGDANVYDAMFAGDIVWGTPKGMSLQGYAGLNRIHHQLMTAAIAPPSTFEVERTISPTPDVVVTQIARRANDGSFSEMAMYVLVRRDDDRWWVAAAQNTPMDVSSVE